MLIFEQSPSLCLLLFVLVDLKLLCPVIWAMAICSHGPPSKRLLPLDALSLRSLPNFWLIGRGYVHASEKG